jgi:outer membrane protein assembly factor BamB/subtilisin family serine protease
VPTVNPCPSISPSGRGTRVLAITLVVLLAMTSVLLAPPDARAAEGPTAATTATPADPVELVAADETPADETPDAEASDATSGAVASLLHADDRGPASAEAGDPSAPGAATDGAGPAGPATVDPDVTARLDDSSDGEVAVIVRLRQQPDADDLAAEAARDGQAAARDARARGQARGQDGRTIAAEARQAAHEARVTTVVEHLQTLAENTNSAVAELLAEREAAGQASDVREYWIFNGFAATVDEETLAELQAHPDVAEISLDRTLEVPEVTSSPRLPTWSLEAVNAPDTWGEFGIRGEGITIGVLDTGVDGNHPALAGSYRGRDGDHASSWYVPTGENYPTPGDGHGHGTHVTGSITGGPPGEVIGVAPDAEWIGIKIFTDGGGTNDSIIADGMQWVLAPGGDPANAPHIVNNSWGHPDGSTTTYWDEVDAWVAAGILPVFANGNNGPGAGTVGAPASYPHSFGVGATDINDVIAGFSSRGPAFWDGEQYLKPQVSAPGHEIFSAWPTHTGQDYHTISGTSMAAPHAAGVAALVLSAAPDLSVEELRDVLQDTVRTEPHMGALPDQSYGHGIVDAFAATERVTIAGTLEGTVTGPDGPIEATVSIPDEDAATTSDPDTGAYELFVREGDHLVVIEAYGYVTEEASVTIEAGEITTLDVELALADTATLSGTVTSGGTPLSGATVSVQGTPLDPVRTDSDGTFSFDIAHGTYDVRATAHGHLPSNVEVVVDGDTSVTIDLEALVQDAAPGWREYQNDAAGTGFVDEEVAPDTFDELWTASLGATVMFSSPVIADGRVYLTTENGRLHAIDATTGETDWTFATGGTQRSTPAVTDDTVYVGGGADDALYAIDLDGELRWTYDTGDEHLVYATPTVVDGTVFIATGFGQGNGGFVHAIDAATGDLEWRGEVGSQIFFGPAVADGIAVAASRDDNRVVAFDAASGDELWATTHDETFISLPTIADGTIYLGTSTNDFTSGSVLALELATGDTVWHTTGHGDTQGNSPVVYGDLVILGSHSHGTVSAYDRATGERVWNHVIGTAVTSAQLVTAGGVVLGGSQDGQAWALDASTGTRLWDHSMPNPVLSATAAGEGMAVVADRGGNVTAFVSTGTIEGTVTGPDGPLGATVRIAETGAETASDPGTGAYELTHRPGSYTLEVWAYGYDRYETPVEIEIGRTLEVDVSLDAVEDGSVAGTIVDEDGAPLEGAEVTLQDTGLDPAMTDVDGDYAFPSVAAGTYAYVADADGYAPQEGTVEVVAGATTILDLTLTRYDIAVVSDYEGAITRSRRRRVARRPGQLR